MNTILEHRQALRDNLEKAFGVNNSIDPDVFLEKARMVGDLYFENGKTYMWTEYAPGKFDWHIVKQNTPVIKGKGVNGMHGIKALQYLYNDINKGNDDVSKMTLKRTPNGNWRLLYNNVDTGKTIAGDVLTQSELKADNVCYQARMTVDNFDMVGDYMEFNSPDDVYFVQVIKRWKDNKDKPGANAAKLKGKADGTYNSGAWYLKHYLIHSKQELENLKSEIVKICSYNNARAYISINSRNETQSTQYIQKFKARYGNDPTNPRVVNAEAVVYGQAKTGPAWRNERLRVLLDVDTQRDSKVKLPNGKTVNVWDETEKRLDDFGIKVVAKYVTPSGGLHLILNNKNNRNLKPFYQGLKDFDGGHNLGNLATVHPSEDIKMVLYSNVETEGY